MSLGLSILGPSNVVQLKPKGSLTSSSSSSSLCINGSQSQVIDSVKRDHISTRSPSVTERERDVPILLCSGYSCLRNSANSSTKYPSDTRQNGDAPRSRGWTTGWQHRRPLGVSEYALSEFGFRRQMLSQSIGMTQQKSFRNSNDLERDIASIAHRHISACQLPGSIKKSSRVAAGFADLKDVLATTDYERDWLETVVPRTRMSDHNSSHHYTIVTRSAVDEGNLLRGRSRSGLCRGLALSAASSSIVKAPSSSSIT